MFKKFQCFEILQNILNFISRVLLVLYLKSQAKMLKYCNFENVGNVESYL